MLSPRHIPLLFCFATLPACSSTSPTNPADASDAAADTLPDAGADAPVDGTRPDTGGDTVKPSDTPADAPHPALTAQLAAARVTWANAKPQCPTYRYDRSYTSFTGWTATTSIEIRNDQPARRDYVSHENRFGTPDAGPTEQWSEIGSQVGTHSTGSPALTVEQIFSLCDSIVANNPHETIIVDIDARGVPAACRFRPVNCADDCDMGFWLSGFACAPLPSGDAGADAGRD